MKFKTKSAVTVAALALGFVFAGAASAAVVTMHFDSINNADGFTNGGQEVNGYYDGGCTTSFTGNARAPDCGGPNYGVTWSNALAGDTGSTNAFWNTAPLSPSAPNAIGFLTGTNATMSVTGGFNTGFSFWYYAPLAGSVVLNGTQGGSAWSYTLNLASTVNNSNCAVALAGAGSCWLTGSFAIPTGVTVDSVDFAGAANNIVFDDITFGSTNPNALPEPAALGMFGLGLLLIGAFVGLRKRYN